MSRHTTYFISDLHLGARYLPDRRLHEAKIVSFLHSIRDTAEAIYLVGDVLDYWYEYRTVVPRGYVRFFGALAALADSGVRITWLTGNHDIWLFDYLRDEIGIEVVDGSIIRDIAGKRFFIAHGDGVGLLKPSFRFIRAMFRNHICQRLYSSIHPRWTVPFAYRWSSGSRCYTPGHSRERSCAMRTSVENWAHDYALSHPGTDYIVLGHHHVVVNEPVSAECRLVILGDWINHDSYAAFNDGKLSIHFFSQEQ